MFNEHKFGCLVEIHLKLDKFFIQPYLHICQRKFKAQQCSHMFAVNKYFNNLKYSN